MLKNITFNGKLGSRELTGRRVNFLILGAHTRYGQFFHKST